VSRRRRLKRKVSGSRLGTCRKTSSAADRDKNFPRNWSDLCHDAGGEGRDGEPSPTEIAGRFTRLRADRKKRGYREFFLRGSKPNGLAPSRAVVSGIGVCGARARPRARAFWRDLHVSENRRVAHGPLIVHDVIA
jgi:hypothetical protein